MQKIRLIKLPFLLFGLSLCGLHTNATTLTFDAVDINGNVTGQISDASLATYGDDVEATTEGSFGYGVGPEGFTPNVQTSFSSFAGVWPSGYGDLTNTLYSKGSEFDPLEITLSADPGFEVNLYGFDMAIFSSLTTTTSIDLNSVKVLNENNLELFSQVPSTIQSSSTSHTSFDFSPELVGQSLTIRIDLSGLSSAASNIGIDNIRFGQQRQSTPAVPSPTAAITGLIGLGLVGARRRRRK